MRKSIVRGKFVRLHPEWYSIPRRICIPSWLYLLCFVFFD
jgi:hypothetical protein